MPDFGVNLMVVEKGIYWCNALTPKCSAKLLSIYPVMCVTEVFNLFVIIIVFEKIIYW